MNKTTPHTVPVIAIVGRPNVGKSSLFNRLAKKRIAITSDISGTTRDRVYYQVEIGDITSIIVDTGGMEYGKKVSIEADVQSQARLAIEEADLILFVVDASENLSANDYEAAQILRKTDKRIILIANKCDQRGMEDDVSQFLELGFGEPIKISTIHRLGLEELELNLAKELRKIGFKKLKPVEKDPNVLNICFLGRPNVGKSSLVNALLGEKKLIVSDIAGTTRDAIDIGILWKDHQINLIDTAGVRRRGKIDRNLEKLSVMRSFEAIERADVVCLILDYSEGLAKQDLHISSYITEAGKGLLLIVNKSDLIENPVDDKNRFIHILKNRFDFLPWAPVVFVSALRRFNIEKILEISQNIQGERNKQIDDEELAVFIKETTYKHLPPESSFTKTRINSMQQINVNPPTFIFQVTDCEGLHFSYKRYLENEIRRKYGFTGTSLKLIFQERIRAPKKLSTERRPVKRRTKNTKKGRKK